MTDEHDPLNPKWTHAEIEILKARGAKPMEFNKIPPPSAAVVQSVIDALSKRTNEAGMSPFTCQGKSTWRPPETTRTTPPTSQPD